MGQVRVSNIKPIYIEAASDANVDNIRAAIDEILLMHSESRDKVINYLVFMIKALRDSVNVVRDRRRIPIKKCDKEDYIRCKIFEAINDNNMKYGMVRIDINEYAVERLVSYTQELRSLIYKYRSDINFYTKHVYVRYINEDLISFEHNVDMPCDIEAKDSIPYAHVLWKILSLTNDLYIMADSSYGYVEITTKAPYYVTVILDNRGYARGIRVRGTIDMITICTDYPAYRYFHIII